MHSLTIVFGPASTAWTLLFKQENKALEYYLAYKKAVGCNLPGRCIIEDDFGQCLSIQLEKIHGVMLEDMDLSQQAAVERGLHQARTQAKAETKAMNDDTIKTAIRAKQQGPAVFQPGMPMGRMS